MRILLTTVIFLKCQLVATLKGYHSPVMPRRPMCTAVFLNVDSCPPSLQRCCTGQLPTRRQDFALAYDLNYDEAIALMTETTPIELDDPANHRPPAAIRWLTRRLQQYPVTVDHYLESFSNTHDSDRPCVLEARPLARNARGH